MHFWACPCGGPTPSNSTKGEVEKSGLTYLNQQNSVNILAVAAYYTPKQQKF